MSNTTNLSGLDISVSGFGAPVVQLTTSGLTTAAMATVQISALTTTGVAVLSTAQTMALTTAQLTALCANNDKIVLALQKLGVTP